MRVVAVAALGRVNKLTQPTFIAPHRDAGGIRHVQGPQHPLAVACRAAGCDGVGQWARSKL